MAMCRSSRALLPNHDWNSKSNRCAVEMQPYLTFESSIYGVEDSLANFLIGR